MKRCLLALLLLLALEAAPAHAFGFGLFRRPTEVRYSSYYVPSTVYYVPSTAYYVPVTPAPIIYPAPMLPPVPVVPSFPVVGPSVGSPFAVPLAAPPSTTAEPPVSPPVRPMSGSTSLRVGESFYDVLPGPMRMDGDTARTRCSVAFWNLTAQTMTLRVDNRDVVLASGKSTTLELPLTFAWQVVGREAGATTIPSGRATAEVLIRR